MTPRAIFDDNGCAPKRWAGPSAAKEAVTSPSVAITTMRTSVGSAAQPTEATAAASRRCLAFPAGRVSAHDGVDLEVTVTFADRHMLPVRSWPAHRKLR